MFYITRKEDNISNLIVFYDATCYSCAALFLEMKHNNQYWKDNVSFCSFSRHPEEFQKYDIDTVPSFVIISEDGEIIEKFSGIVSYYYDEVQDFVINGENNDN